LVSRIANNSGSVG